ncbi:hypothetical protein MHTCC0001_34310 [Flavobacteriaceae bacterium MHTCC 0001]
MKKIFYLTIFIFVSCSNEVTLNEDQGDTDELILLEFSSVQEMENKINEIENLKSNLESKIVSGFIPSSDDFGSSDLENLDYGMINGSLVEYHTLKLKNIFTLRFELGFTSIQSIVEEINSLKIINPAKSLSLFNEYEHLLERTKFEVISIFDSRVSNILNKEGKVMIAGELVGLDKEIPKEDGSHIDGTLLRNNNLIMPDGQDTGGGGTTTRLQNDTGILLMNNLFLVTWDVGKIRNRSNIFHRYDYFTRLSGYIRTPDNKYVSYPISWELEPNSSCEWDESKLGFIRVGFPTNFSNVTHKTVRGYGSSRNFYLKSLYIKRGVFSITIGHETYTVLSDPFRRSYDNYDPDQPPLFD